MRYGRGAPESSDKEECTCRTPAVRSTDIDPPAHKAIRDRWCAVHGKDPDDAYEEMFPIFSTHSRVMCWHCGADLDGSPWEESGYPIGSGRYTQYCRRDDVLTYYDLEPEISKQMEEAT